MRDCDLQDLDAEPIMFVRRHGPRALDRNQSEHN